MSENRTHHTTHAASGEMRLSRGKGPPDTVVKLPDGKTLILKRPDRDIVHPKFRKYNPRKIKPKQSAKDAFSQARTIPFNKLVVAAFLLHQAFGIVRGFWARRKAAQSRALTAQTQEEEWEELQNDPEIAAAQERLQRELLPAMMRNAMPRPPRNNMAHRASETSRLRKRKFTTAKEMMRPAPTLKQRSPGMLGRIDKAVQKEATALMLSQSQQQQAQHEQTIALLQSAQERQRALAWRQSHALPGRPSSGVTITEIHNTPGRASSALTASGTSLKEGLQEKAPSSGMQGTVQESSTMGSVTASSLPGVRIVSVQQSSSDTDGGASCSSQRGGRGMRTEGERGGEGDGGRGETDSNAGPSGMQGRFGKGGLGEEKGGNQDESNRGDGLGRGSRKPRDLEYIRKR